MVAIRYDESPNWGLLFIRVLDYYKINPPGNVKSSENVLCFDRPEEGLLFCDIKKIKMSVWIKLKKQFLDYWLKRRTKLQKKWRVLSAWQKEQLNKHLLVCRKKAKLSVFDFLLDSESMDIWNMETDRNWKYDYLNLYITLQFTEELERFSAIIFTIN